MFNTVQNVQVTSSYCGLDDLKAANDLIVCEEPFENIIGSRNKTFEH